MKNPNICRYIMYALIIIGWLIAGIAGVVFGVKPVHSLFVIGLLISLGAQSLELSLFVVPFVIGSYT